MTQAKKGNIEALVGRLMPGVLLPFWDRLQKSDIGYRLAHGAFWSTVGAVVFQSLMLLISIIAARLLGKEQFGQYGIIIATVGMFNVFAGFGLGTTATKFVAEFRQEDPERAGRIIGMSTVTAIVTGGIATILLFGFAPTLAERTLAAPELSSMLRLACGLIFFGAVNSSQIGALAGFQSFRSIARINLFSGLLSFVCVTSGMLLFGLVGGLAGQVLALALACLVSNYALHKEAHRFGVVPQYSGCGEERGLLIKFSLPAVLCGLMVSPVTWACSAILVNQTNGYAEMGIFNAANSWQKAILFLPSCIGGIALPMLSELHTNSDRIQYRQALKYNLIVNSAAALLAFAFVAAFSQIIMKTYGAQFASGYLVLIILSLSSVMIAVGSVVGNVLASKGRMWTGFTFNLCWAVIMLMLAFYMVPKYGAMGLAITNLIAYVVHTLIQTTYAFADLR